MPTWPSCGAVSPMHGSRSSTAPATRCRATVPWCWPGCSSSSPSLTDPTISALLDVLTDVGAGLGVVLIHQLGLEGFAGGGLVDRLLFGLLLGLGLGAHLGIPHRPRISAPRGPPAL